MFRVSSLCPGIGRDIFDLPVGHRWQVGEHVMQVGPENQAACAAGFDDRVEDPTAFVLYRLPKGTSGTAASVKLLFTFNPMALYAACVLGGEPNRASILSIVALEA